MSDNNSHKQCVKCFQFKQFNDFHKCKNGRLGLFNYCKTCASLHKRAYIKNNYEKIRAHKQKPEVKERIRFLNRIRYRDDKEYRERLLERNRIRRRKEPAKQQERFRLKTDIQYKLIRTCRKRIQYEIRRMKRNLNIEIQKTSKTIDLLGCSIFDLKKHLESKFQPGMMWENHGYGDNCWHIDHIKPCASFDLTDPEQQRKCFHYSNLQPLWQKDNLLKSDKII